MKGMLQAKVGHFERLEGGGINHFPGNHFYLDPANGSDGNDGKTPDTAKQTLAEAYALLTDGANDTLHLIGNGTSLTLPAATTRLFDWGKSYTHFVGECAPVGVGNRARIFAASTATAATMFRLSGSGCIFQDLSFFYGVDSAAAKYCLEVTGSRNFLGNVRIAGIGNDTQDVSGAASLFLNGGAENTFENCPIGLTTVGRGTAVNSEILMDANAARNSFIGGKILCRADANTHTFITVADATGAEDWNEFCDVKFINISTNHAVEMLSAITIPAAPSTMGFIIDKCPLVGCADWEVNNRGQVFVFNAAAATAATDGKAFKIV